VPIPDYLSGREFNGIFGKYRFDKDGEIVGLNFGIKRIEGGKAVEVEGK
jgi:hypothetical protein